MIVVIKVKALKIHLYNALTVQYYTHIDRHLNTAFFVKRESLVWHKAHIPQSRFLYYIGKNVYILLINLILT